MTSQLRSAVFFTSVLIVCVSFKAQLFANILFMLLMQITKKSEFVLFGKWSHCSVGNLNAFLLVVFLLSLSYFVLRQMTSFVNVFFLALKQLMNSLSLSDTHF